MIQAQSFTGSIGNHISTKLIDGEGNWMKVRETCIGNKSIAPLCKGQNVNIILFDSAKCR